MVIYFAMNCLPMTKKILFIFFLLYSITSFSQDNRNSISGIVEVDSLSVENIHVINKTSNIATLTNQYGEFTIPVKEQDTLLFSSVQFENKQITISKEHISNLKLVVNLKVDITNLNEVIVKQHNLTGNLAIDAINNRDSIYESIESRLQFSSSEIISDFDKTKTYRPKNSVDPIGGQSGIDITQLFRLVRLKLKKKKTKKKNKEEEPITLTIRKELGDVFFVQNLKIPLKEIDTFLMYCNAKQLLTKLHQENKQIELIEFLINQSKTYLKGNEK